MRLIRRLAAAGALVLAAAMLAACAPTLSLPPAPDANNPLCAEVTARLGTVPAIGDQERRWTDAQATGAWGDEAVILSCGWPAPPPTAEYPCVRLGGVDWLVDTERAPNLRMTSYGRDPAVQVWVRTTVISSNEALRRLGPIVANIPETSRCISPGELPADFEG